MSEKGTEPCVCWGKWLLWLLVMVLLALTIAPILMRQKLLGDYTKASQNAKSIGYALFNFQHDFRYYPNDQTAHQLDEGAMLSRAGGSNYYFSQLIAAGYVDQEAPFYAKTGNTLEPDNDKSTADEILKSGEVGFVYVVWKCSADDLSGESPLMFAYLGEDMKASGSTRIMILRCDMSVGNLHPERSGEVMHKGKNYFNWSQAHWGGQKPKIVWPE